MMNVLILAVDGSHQSLAFSAKYNQTKYFVIVLAVVILDLLADIQQHLVSGVDLTESQRNNVNTDAMPEFVFSG